jgi:hypothetical protein
VTAQLALARSAVPDLRPYDATAIHREHTRTVARLGTLRKELAERSALKFDLSVSAVSSTVGVVSAVFIVAGFLSVRYFYQRMGVDVSLYFSAADYLAASVEQIRLGAFSAAISLGTFAFGVRSGSLRSRLHIRASATTRRREGWAIGFFTVATFGASAYSIYVERPDFHLMRICGLLISYWISHYVAITFFRNRLSAMAAIVGVLIFGTTVAVSVYERSENLLTGRNAATYRQQVHFKEGAPQLTAGELFGANGSYYFIYDRDKDVTQVVPRDRVAQIDVTRLAH